MARNQAGTYSLPAGSLVGNGETSDASDVNIPFSDLETDANTARPIVAGGTGATTAAQARANLLAQTEDATLTSLAALGTGADKYAYTTGIDTWAEGDITAFGRSLIDDADAAAAQATLGLGSVATEDMPDDSDLSNNGSAPARRDNVKAYTDAAVAAASPFGAVIASGTFTGTGTPAWQHQKGFDLTIVDSGTGNYLVAFDAEEPDTNYTVLVSIEASAAFGLVLARYSSKTVNGFRVRVLQSNTATDQDADLVSVVVVR